MLLAPGCSVRPQIRPEPGRDLERYLRTENEKVETFFKPLSSLTRSLYTELLTSDPKDPPETPIVIHGFHYWLQQDVGDRYPRLLRSKPQGSSSEVILDQNVLALAHPQSHLSFLRISPDNECIVYGLQTLDSATSSAWVHRISTDTNISIQQTNAIDAQWGRSCKDLFLLSRDQNGIEHLFQASEAMRGAQEILRTETPQQSLLLKKSESEKFLFANIFTFETDDIYAVDLDRAQEGARQVQKKEAGVKYQVTHFADGFLVLTFKNASTGMLLYKSLDGKHAREILPPTKKVLERMRAFSKFAVVLAKQPPIPELLILDASSFEFKVYQPLSSFGVLKIPSQIPFDATSITYSVETLTSPPQQRQIGLQMKLQELPLHGSELHYAKSKDGTLVPLSLVLPNTVPAPFLLHGYGAYGIDADEKYSPELQSLLSRGVGYAVCHGRGGGEMGPAWHSDGSGDYRNKAEEDFIACAQYLKDKHLVFPEKLFATGRSAGAYLVIAAAHKEPHLFSGLLLESPLIDPTYPMQLNEKDRIEWGSAGKLPPADIKNIYVFTGQSDPLTPVQPIAEWFSGVTKFNNGEKLLRTSSTASHAGESDYYDAINERARAYVFLLEAIKS